MRYALSVTTESAVNFKVKRKLDPTMHHVGHMAPISKVHHGCLPTLLHDVNCTGMFGNRILGSNSGFWQDEIKDFTVSTKDGAWKLKSLASLAGLNTTVECASSAQVLRTLECRESGGWVLDAQSE